MKHKSALAVLLELHLLAASLFLCLALPTLPAQDPVGAVEGRVTDASGGTIAAHATLRNLDTDTSRETSAAASGIFRFAQVPVGRYSITVDAEHFATVVQQPITVNISQNVRLQFALEVSAVKSTVDVQSDASLVDISTNALGAVVTGHEILDLPLNGRNFTQLGLLQSGVAPLSQAMARFGGSLRSNQAYAVNGMRPESNN